MQKNIGHVQGPSRLEIKGVTKWQGQKKAAWPQQGQTNESMGRVSTRWSALWEAEKDTLAASSPIASWQVRLDALGAVGAAEASDL